MGMLSAIIRRKSVDALTLELQTRRDFPRTLDVWQLTAIGLGSIVGVGIFVLAGQQAAVNAGPAVAPAFIIAGVASAAAALCYAEFAGMIPVAESSCTYTYAVLGELAAWLLPIGDLTMLVNIGVLSAFVVICSSVVILRHTRPEITRAFRTPWVPVVPLIGVGFSIWLLARLPGSTWWRFIVWMAVGLGIYFGYGIKKSALSR